MPKTKVVLNEAGLNQLLRDPGVRADVDRRAEQVLDAARAEAPVHTGEYRDRLHIEHVTAANGIESVRVTAGTDHDIYVEAEHGTLAKALDAAGGD